MKEESEKAGLVKKKIRASSHTISWQTDVKEMETVAGFIFLGSKITVDGDHNHEIKKCLLLGRKAMTNLDRIWQTDILQYVE